MSTLNLRTPTSYNGQKATQYKMGAVRLATDEEAIAAVANNVALTPSQGALSVPAASTTVAGIVKLSTNAQAVTGTDATTAVTPAALTARLAAPGAIGGTTPAAASFTTLATSGDYTATTGNIIINSAAKQLRVHGGAVTDFIGTATLASGTTGAIANTNIAATDRIMIQRTAANASTTLGELTYTISAAASFTITSVILGTPGSTQTADVSSVVYFIVRQV